jgi:hypothetical protein
MELAMNALGRAVHDAAPDVGLGSAATAMCAAPGSIRPLPTLLDFNQGMISPPSGFSIAESVVPLRAHRALPRSLPVLDAANQDIDC